MTARTSAFRSIPVFVALLALGGCAPIEGDGDLLVGESEQALITEVSVPALDGSSKDASFAAAKQERFSPSNFRFTIGDLPVRAVSKVESFKFENTAPTRGRIAPERTVELVLTDATVEELEALFEGEPSSARLTSFDDEGSPIMEMQLVGVRLIGRPKVVSMLGDSIAVKLGYDALSMGTP